LPVLARCGRTAFYDLVRAGSRAAVTDHRTREELDGPEEQLVRLTDRDRLRKMPDGRCTTRL
jgi:hypothetical protein